MNLISRVPRNNSYGDAMDVTTEFQELRSRARRKSSPGAMRARKARLCAHAHSMLTTVRELARRDADFIDMRRGSQLGTTDNRRGELRSGWRSRGEHAAGDARSELPFVRGGE